MTHSHMLAVLAHAYRMTYSSYHWQYDNSCHWQYDTSDLTLYRRVGGIVDHVELNSVQLESDADDYYAFWCASGSRIVDG